MINPGNKKRRENEGRDGDLYKNQSKQKQGLL